MSEVVLIGMIFSFAVKIVADIYFQAQMLKSKQNGHFELITEFQEIKKAIKSLEDRLNKLEEKFSQQQHNNNNNNNNKTTNN